MTLPINSIITGDALEVMKDWPDESINCCISSPPYWALRDYGVDGQLGLEPTFEEYIDKLCTYYDEVFRVLRKDGTCWVNLGDTYGTHNAGGKGYAHNFKSEDIGQRWNKPKQSIPEKSLCLIPYRFAIEMVNRGWILRNVIVWSKPNPMPSSAKDRFTVDFEPVFFFTKNRRYFFEPQYEPYQYDGRHDTILKPTDKYPGGRTPQKMEREPMERWPCPLGRNKRTTWTIPTQPTPEAHFATFPEDLVRPMVKAGCPRYVCKKCGKPRVKIIEASGGTIGQDWNLRNRAIGGKRAWDKTQQLAKEVMDGSYKKEFKGYSDCGCNAGWTPGVVLDPFAEQRVPARWRQRKVWTISA